MGDRIATVGFWILLCDYMVSHWKGIIQDKSEVQV